MNFFYSAYNFVIESEFKCHGLVEISSCRPDVKICRSLIPDHFQNVKKKIKTHAGTFKMNGNGDMLVEFSNAARFFISNGTHIIVDPYSESKNRIVQTFLFGTVFSLLLHQRGLFTLHGSAVTRNGKCIIFSGKSKAGKSTFANIFQKNGYKLITDDVCLLKPCPNGDFLVHPAIPQLSLRDDMVDRFNIHRNELQNTGTAEKKFLYNLKNNFEYNALPITVIYEITPGDKDLKIHTVKGMHKINILIKNTYRLEAVKQLGLYNEHFNLFSGIAKKIPIKRIERPTRNFIGDGIVQLVEKDLKYATENPV